MNEKKVRPKLTHLFQFNSLQLWVNGFTSFIRNQACDVLLFSSGIHTLVCTVNAIKLCLLNDHSSPINRTQVNTFD